MYVLRVRPEAAEDLLAARDWYDGQQAGLGDRLAAEVSSALEQLKTMPEMFRIRWHDVRAARLKRFPYVVYYRILGQTVEVLAVLHGSRDPSSWQARS